MNKRALIAMSGGVDSAVAAILMREAGYECIGATMKLIANGEPAVTYYSQNHSKRPALLPCFFRLVFRKRFIMLVVNGFFENGVFVPEKPLANIKGRQRAILNIDEIGKNEKQERLNAWREFSQAIRASDEELSGEPERIRFRTLEEIEAL
jgi:NH3-dependent NAD+ synthetase